MTLAKIGPAVLVLLAIAGATASADAASRPVQTPLVARASDTVMATDLSASRRHAGRVRHITRVRIYRRGDYSFFEPYAPSVPPFFPFGYHQAYL